MSVGPIPGLTNDVLMIILKLTRLNKKISRVMLTRSLYYKCYVCTMLVDLSLIKVDFGWI